MAMNRIEQIKQMLEKTPGDDFLKHALALEYLKTGEEETAKDCFIGLLKNNPQYVGSYYHLALLLDRLGERDEAIRYFEQGMQLAKEKGDNHAFNELRSAYEEMIY
jgi:Tfp pilus assembly protein PilF